jgi:hypothetical protein
MATDTPTYVATHAARYDYDRREIVLYCGKTYDEMADGTTRIASFVTCSDCVAVLPAKRSH